MTYSYIIAVANILKVYKAKRYIKSYNNFVPSILFLVDYTLSGIPTTVTIPASDPDMRTCFNVSVMKDLIALEPNETFSLKIDNISPDNSRIVRGIDTTVITIIDDNRKFSKINDQEYKNIIMVYSYCVYNLLCHYPS